MQEMIYLQRSQLAIFGIGIVVLAGCGGGGGQSGTAPTGPSQTTSLGQGAITYIGQPKPRITATSGSVTVSGMAGAIFTAVNVSPAPSLNNTYLAYSRYQTYDYEIYTLPYSGENEQLITHTLLGAFWPAISKTGYMAYESSVNGSPYLMRADGSSSKLLSYTNAEGIFTSPSISPYANYLAFCNNGTLWYSPLSGGTATAIQNSANQNGTSFEPNNTTIAYTANNSSGYSNVYTTPITGGTPTNVTPTSLQSTGNWYNPNCCSDGVTIAAAYLQSRSSTYQIWLFGSNTANAYPITPAGFSDTYPCFSPDGTQIAFYRSSAGGATPGIYVCDYSGAHQRLFYADPSGSGAATYLAWSPFPYTQLMLGAGANLYSGNVNGFLLSQNGSQYGGICGFTTATPSTASITSQTSSSTGAPLVFTLSGDNITMIEYSNSFFSLHGETLVQPTGTNPSALITVDPTTGGIDTVAVAASIVAHSSAKVAGGGLTYTAKFSAIYDKTGKNLAPSGAKQIVVNPATGKLVSFQ